MSAFVVSREDAIGGRRDLGVGATGDDGGKRGLGGGGPTKDGEMEMLHEEWQLGGSAPVRRAPCPTPSSMVVATLPLVSPFLVREGEEN